MLKPIVQVHTETHALVAEFWDCLRLDLAPVKELRGKYEAHLRSNGPPILVVDLLGVAFAGSAALGLFVNLQKLVRQGGGQVIFCNVDPTVYEVFRISRLNPLFVFVADRPEALAMAARLARKGDEGGGPSTGPPPPSPPEPGTPRNPGNEGLLRRHRRKNV